MKGPEFQYQQIYGNEIKNHVSEVAAFRIKYFRDFPYLYVGSSEYEEKYLNGYSEDSKAILVKGHNLAGDLVAVSTALPLVTSSDILSGASEMFQSFGFNPEKIYYYGEIILDYSIRGIGISRRIYDLQDVYAKRNGFQQVVIATVEREDLDSRKPIGYLSIDALWKKLGFTKTSLTFEYEWPTIQLNGKVEAQMNPMVYWIKQI
jgi:hypothetical protein